MFAKPALEPAHALREPALQLAGRDAASQVPQVTHQLITCRWAAVKQEVDPAPGLAIVDKLHLVNLSKLFQVREGNRCAIVQLRLDRQPVILPRGAERGDNFKVLI